jgi:acyl-homoserine lactone acylase PvdQ
MFHWTKYFVISIVVLSAPVASAADGLPGEGADAGKTVVYRDTWGIPHIYAPTDEAGLYAQGYATAEDRPEQLLTNILAAIGEISSITGPDTVQSDLRSHMFDHYGIGKRKYNELSSTMRSHMEAYCDGINDYYASHPAHTPPWWGSRKVDPYMLVAFGRLFLYNWSIDEAYGDLKRGGIEPGYEREQRGSNQFSVSPARSASGAAILAIDPHLSWFGPSRFWECRIHAGDLHGSGVTLPGSPYIGLGHNANLAWAMTTGGPDTADVFELKLKEDDHSKYWYDGEWKSLTSRKVTLNVRGQDDETHTLWRSHHGPIIAVHGRYAYAAAMAYDGIADVSSAWYELNYAKDYKGAIKAMETLTVFPQNVMVADTAGNIYYQRTGKVPRRSLDYDWSKPVDGTTSKSDWQGFHPSSDHLQVLNPSIGFMQNCNIPPDAMIPDSPFSVDKQPHYLFSSKDHGSRLDGWTNQRGARAIQLLQDDSSVTPAEAMQYINDVHVFGVERWQDILKQAHQLFGHEHQDVSDYTNAINDVLNWNGNLEKDSTGALKFYYWRERLVFDYGAKALRELSTKIDDWYHIVEDRAPKDFESYPNELQALLGSFVTSMEKLKQHHGSLAAVYGDKFRVGRDDESWPTGGGGDFGTRTLRSMGYEKEKEDHTRWGRSGQTSTQVVHLTKPIQSWIYIPIGQSDVKDSPHYTDQAEHLFSKRQMKPSWWLPEDLAGNIESRTVLENAPVN